MENLHGKQRKTSELNKRWWRKNTRSTSTVSYATPDGDI